MFSQKKVAPVAAFFFLKLEVDKGLHLPAHELVHGDNRNHHHQRNKYQVTTGEPLPVPLLHGFWDPMNKIAQDNQKKDKTITYQHLPE